MTSYSFSKCGENILSSVIIKRVKDIINKNNTCICYVALIDDNIYKISYDKQEENNIKTINLQKEEININKDAKTIYIIETDDNTKIDNIISKFKDYKNLILIFCSKDIITYDNIDEKYKLSGYNYVDELFSNFSFKDFEKNKNFKKEILEKIEKTPLGFFIIFATLESLIIFLEPIFPDNTKIYLYATSMILSIFTIILFILFHTYFE
jgi:hypothetical protein